MFRLKFNRILTRVKANRMVTNTFIIMEKPQCSEAYNILNQPQEFKSLRSSPEFINRLAENPIFLKDFLDICFRPHHFEKTYKVVLTPNLPATAIEALSSLYEELISLLAYDKIISKDPSLEVFDLEADVPVREEEEKQEFIYLKHMHQAFGDPECEDAAISNLSRILGPLYYQSPEKLMNFYQKQQKEKMLLLSSLWRRNVMEIFCKLLQAESGKQFFLEYKARHLDNYYNLLLQGITSRNRHQWLESLLQLHRFVMEKMEQRYDGNKYTKLLQTMNNGDESLFKLLLKDTKELPQSTALICMRLCEECLKKDSYIWAASDLRVPVTNLSRKYSMSNSFYQQQGGKKKVYHVRSVLLQLIVSFLSALKTKMLQSQTNSTLHLINFFKGLYFWVKIVSAGNENGTLSLESLLQATVNEQMLSKCFLIVQKHPTSTPLHNYIKEFIIQCLNLKLILHEYFICEDNPYFQTLLRWLPRKQNGRTVPFGPQSYHIFNELSKLKCDLPKEVASLLVCQKSRRETLIGGSDPRKFQESLRGSNAFSEESQQVFEIDIPSLKSNLSNGPVFQLSSSTSSLRLTNVLSIEKSISQQGEHNEEAYNKNLS